MSEEKEKNNKIHKLNKKPQYDFQLSVLGKGIKFDWIFLISTLVLFFIVNIAYSYLNHKRISGFLLSESELNKSEINILDIERIQELMNNFEKRKKVLNNFE